MSIQMPGQNSVAAAVRVAQPSRPRKRKELPRDMSVLQLTTAVTKESLKQWQESYNANPNNETLRNVVTFFGPSFAATSDAKARSIIHEFTNTHRVPHYKASSQGNSGRCWMFAGLNTLRAFVMEKFGMKKNFEFSATYLFFFDKLERARSYLLTVAANLDAPDDDRFLMEAVDLVQSDGGYFNYFANLVDKYGLVPETAMPETALSGFTSEMNEQLVERLKTTAYIMRRDRNKMGDAERAQLIKNTMKAHYSDLVKCLGEPPKKFNWAFYNEDDQWVRIGDTTPRQFLQACTPIVDLNGI